MDGKTRIAAALSADRAALSATGATELGVVIPYEGIYIRDHWAELTDLPWWAQFAPDLETQLAWRGEVMARIGQDWFALPACPTREERAQLVIEPRPDGVWRVNRRTGQAQRLRPPVVGGWNDAHEVESIHPTRLAETPAEVDALIPPPDDDLTPYTHGGRADLAAALCAAHPDLYPLASISAPLWRCYSLWGFEGLMELVARRPELVEHACRRALAHAQREAAIAFTLGAAGVWIEDCLTDMISPAAFSALNTPFLQRLVGAIQALGMQAIYYYCGNPAGKWEQLFAIGADALALEESKKGFTVEIEDVVARASGHCAVLGNLDAIHTLPEADEAALRREIARQMAAGRRNGGRFVLSLGSPVTPGTSAARVRRYCDLGHELACFG